MAHSDLDAKSIAIESMKIAASICLYTNEEFEVKNLPNPKKK
jgi:ATP-dependent HslUV protease subunit HslV